MTQSLHIPKIGRFDVTLADLPGSKSLTNRALLLASLAEGNSTLTNVLFADDSRVMLAALKTLGFDLKIDEPNRSVTITGQGGRIPTMDAELMLGNAGTAMRFLAAAVCLGQGLFILDGVPRMRQRPIEQLVDPLVQLAAHIEYGMDQGFPPLRIFANGLDGGVLQLQPTISSQYISALLIAAPYMRRGLTIVFDGPVTSEPYVLMTLNAMNAFGLQHCKWDPVERSVEVEGGQNYTGVNYAIEPDASNASYFLAAAAVIPGSRCVIHGLGTASCQGDVSFINALSSMGCKSYFHEDRLELTGPASLNGIDVNFNSTPDMAQTLAVAALFAQGPTIIRDIGNLRVKETDRLQALKNELTKLGAMVEIKGDDLHIQPPPAGQLKPAAIDTYDDHRMAMSFAVAGLATGQVTINDPACVNKTFPEYWEYLKRLG